VGYQQQYLQGRQNDQCQPEQCWCQVDV
jgi:hypothetical protein